MHQENPSSQTTHSAEKGSQAAAAIAKLERYAHTPTQSPAKGNQQTQAKSQTGDPGDRKSQGEMSSVLSTTKTVSKKSPEGDALGNVTETALDLTN